MNKWVWIRIAILVCGASSSIVRRSLSREMLEERALPDMNPFFGLAWMCVFQLLFVLLTFVVVSRASTEDKWRRPSWDIPLIPTSRANLGTRWLALLHFFAASGVALYLLDGMLAAMMDQPMEPVVWNIAGSLMAFAAVRTAMILWRKRLAASGSGN